MNFTIDQTNLALKCGTLADQDKDLAKILKLYGAPPLWNRPGGFPTLIQIILEQQVSLSSAKAAFTKCEQTVGIITPESILSLTDEQMKAAYFSRQKTNYARNLALAVLERSLDLNHLEILPDSEVRTQLMQIKGIGRWTADIYLLMALSRPDVMPVGDLALLFAWQRLRKLENRPKPEDFIQISRKWKPLRSVAARLLWHYYLNLKSTNRSR